MQLGLSATGGDFRKCSKCGGFRKWDGGKGWHRRQCPECERERRRQWDAANADARREYMRQWRAANPEKVRERKRQHYAANSDALREYQRQYRAANPENVRERKRRYNAANAEAIQEYQRQYRAANADTLREYDRQYQAEKPDVRRKSRRNYRARKLNAVCQHGAGCFDQAIALLPQRCAEPGCRRRKRLEADHIIPLVKGGLDCKDNLQLLCAYHNRSKSATDPIVWAQRNRRLL